MIFFFFFFQFFFLSTFFSVVILRWARDFFFFPRRPILSSAFFSGLMTHEHDWRTRAASGTHEGFFVILSDSGDKIPLIPEVAGPSGESWPGVRRRLA